MKREVIATDNAPGAVGPYSQGIVSGDFVFTSGQIGLDPATGKLVEGGIEAQTAQVFKNLRGVLEAAGTSLEHVVKATVFLVDIADFAKVNAVYAEYFDTEPPARACVQVAALPGGAPVEIELVAYLGD